MRNIYTGPYNGMDRYAGGFSPSMSDGTLIPRDGDIYVCPETYNWNKPQSVTSVVTTGDAANATVGWTWVSRAGGNNVAASVNNDVTGSGVLLNLDGYTRHRTNQYLHVATFQAERNGIFIFKVPGKNWTQAVFRCTIGNKYGDVIGNDDLTKLVGLQLMDSRWSMSSTYCADWGAQDSYDSGYGLIIGPVCNEPSIRNSRPLGKPAPIFLWWMDKGGPTPPAVECYRVKRSVQPMEVYERQSGQWVKVNKVFNGNNTSSPWWSSDDLGRLYNISAHDGNMYVWSGSQWIPISDARKADGVTPYP